VGYDWTVSYDSYYTLSYEKIIFMGIGAGLTLLFFFFSFGQFNFFVIKT